MDYKRKEFKNMFGTLFLGWIMVLFSSCSESDFGNEISNSTLQLTGITIPSSISVAKGGIITLTGKGFLVDDIITLTLNSDDMVSNSSKVSSVTEVSADFILPEDMTTDTYQLGISRGEDSLALGSVFISITLDTDVPDVEGMNVKGVVSCDGVGVPNVVVSDGYEVTKTDGDGIYYLSSTKESGYVFISVPANYEVASQGRLPQFYKYLGTTISAVEQNDFSLIKTDNTNHVVLAMADWHLANRTDDLSQYVSTVLPDINTTIAEYEAEGKKVYGLTLGDLTWDLFWYSNAFSIGEYIQYMNMVDCPVFNVIGNHDNDPYVINDWLAEVAYRMYLGPTYYSFNLGNVHYIVLDDTYWINDGAMQGVIGSRGYDNVITQIQLDWLEKDLSCIEDKNTRIVVASHIPLFKTPSLDDNGDELTSEYNIESGEELTSLLADFEEVHFLSGHTHLNYTVEKDNILEHNTGAICGTWWWTNKTGYSGNHLSREGSPGGYGVYDVSATDMTWYFKGAGCSKDYQFRAYDLNTVHITSQEFAPNASEEDLAVYSGEYATSTNSNEVLVHVWGYDSEWNVEMFENGTPLDVSRVTCKDPLHIISYETFRLNLGAVPTSSFATGTTSNMFKARASSASSTIEIKVTNRFGKVFTESMERPKTFNLSIK